jgi:predicted CoA-binding protein
VEQDCSEGRTPDPVRILAAARRVLLVDWPSAVVPDTLTEAGHLVYVKGGPEPDNFSLRELTDEGPVSRRLDAPPDRVDLVYDHRPLDELPAIVELAQRLGATAVWHQSGRDRDGGPDPTGCWLSDDDRERAHAIVESAGLTIVVDDYIADVARPGE